MPYFIEVDKEPKAERHNIVVKSNQLIQNARFSLSAQQQKIVLYIISKIEPFDDDFKLYQFKITDFCQVCGIEPKGNIYSLLKTQIKNISDKSLWIENEQGVETLCRWIKKPYIDKRSGTMQIQLDEDLKPYLLQIKEKFTEYELIYTLNFKSKYSIRLYEYLKSIHYDKLKPYNTTIEIEEFQRMLDSTYTNFKDFHARVLKPTYKEINQYSDMNFEYELIKSKKTVTHIKIAIETKEIISRIETSHKNEMLLNSKIKG